MQTLIQVFCGVRSSCNNWMHILLKKTNQLVPSHNKNHKKKHHASKSMNGKKGKSLFFAEDDVTVCSSLSCHEPSAALMWSSTSWNWRKLSRWPTLTTVISSDLHVSYTNFSISSPIWLVASSRTEKPIQPGRIAIEIDCVKLHVHVSTCTCR